MGGQTFALLGIEDGIAFEERNFPLGLLTLSIGLGAGDAVGIDDQFAAFALLDVAAQFKRLFEGRPDRAGITLLDGGRPQHDDVDAFVVNAVVTQRASDAPGGVVGVPRLHPWPHSLFEIGNDAICDLGVNVSEFAHVPAPSFWIAKQRRLLPGAA